MAQKTRLQLETNSPGFIRKCVGCFTRIEPGQQYYRDLDSEDDLCEKCASYFITNRYAVVITE